MWAVTVPSSPVFPSLPLRTNSGCCTVSHMLCEHGLALAGRRPWTRKSYGWGALFSLCPTLSLSLPLTLSHPPSLRACVHAHTCVHLCLCAAVRPKRWRLYRKGRIRLMLSVVSPGETGKGGLKGEIKKHRNTGVGVRARGSLGNSTSTPVLGAG